MIKYIIYPGWVKSQYDNEMHWITGSQLMQLYKVKPSECLVFHSPDDLRGIDFSEVEELRPRHDGDYSFDGAGDSRHT